MGLRIRSLRLDRRVPLYGVFKYQQSCHVDPDLPHVALVHELCNRAFTGKRFALWSDDLPHQSNSSFPNQSRQRSLLSSPSSRVPMASNAGSSRRLHDPVRGDWGSCAVSCLHLEHLAKQGYLPTSDLTTTRVGLTSMNGQVHIENHPSPREGERVCFISCLLCRLGFPIHPFLRGLLEFYGIQLHNLTPGSILHISGFVALCEIFLGCEPHFDLWRKYFYLAPRRREEPFSRWAAPKYGG